MTASVTTEANRRLGASGLVAKLHPRDDRAIFDLRLLARYAEDDSSKIIDSFPGSFTRLARANSDFQASLTKARRAYEKNPGISGGRDALTTLWEAGSIYLEYVFGYTERKRLIVAMDHYLNGSREFPTRFEIVAPSDFPIMLQFTPTRPAPPRANPRDAGELCDFAESFPIFRSVVRRLTYDLASPSGAHGLIAQDHEIYGLPQVPILVLWHETVSSGSEELEFLRSLSPNDLEYLGHIPESAMKLQAEDDLDLVDKIAGNIISPPSFTTSSGKDFPCQMIHLIGHSSVHDDGIDSSSFQVARWVYEDQQKPPILQEVGISRGSILRLSDTLGITRLERGPIAMLSSCEGVALSFLDNRSFVGRFLNLGYRAVIGAETKVPGRLALEFTKNVYLALVANNKLGMSIHYARIALLYDGNPLGFLFGAFGDVDLRRKILS